MSLIEFYCMPCQRSAPSSVDTILLLKHRILAILVCRHAIITLTSDLDDALGARRVKICLCFFNLADVRGQRRLGLALSHNSPTRVTTLCQRLHRAATLGSASSALFAHAILRRRSICK
jgi:hypothetical protein